MADARAAAHQVQLPDGRTIGWDERGAPDGFPVVVAHGGLSCRLDSEAAEEPARRADIRLIAPDRPGLGGSDPKPGRSILDWADDVEHLADHLGLDRFAVYGWSAGGVYALGCGRKLPDRVSEVALVAGTTDLSRPEEFALLSRMDQRLTRLARRRPRVATTFFSGLRQFMGLAPRAAARSSSRSLGETERAELERWGGGRRIVDSYREATRQGGAGMTQDYRTYSSAWGFGGGDVQVPVTVWQGSDDTLVVPTFAHRLVDRIPGAQLRYFEGAGHLMLVDRWPDLFASLAPARPQ